MGKAPPASERLPSQRAGREERGAEAEAAALKLQIQELQRDLADANRKRIFAETACRKAEAALAEKQEKRNAKGKMSRSAADTHAKAAAKRWIGKYHADDIPKLAMAIVYKAGKELKKDMLPGIQKSRLMQTEAEAGNLQGARRNNLQASQGAVLSGRPQRADAALH